MTNINLKINETSAEKVSQKGRLTTGMVGATVTFEFGNEWEKYKKAAVFRSGGITKSVFDIGNTVRIPVEVLQKEGYLDIGVEGYNDENVLVYPTKWARGAWVYAGANASGDPAADPTLPIWAQLQTMIGDLSDLDTEAKANLVAAVNELAAKSGGTVDDEAVAKLVEQYLADNPLEESDPTVPAWAKQPKKPSYTADEVGALPQSTPIPATAHDIGAIPAPPTAKIGETIVVKAVDEDGKPTEWRTINNSGVSIIGEYVVETDIDERTAITLEGLNGNSSSYFVYVSANAKGIPPYFFINGKQVGGQWTTGVWTGILQIRILRDYINKRWIVRYRAANTASLVYTLNDESDILESVGYSTKFSANTTIAVCDSFEASIWKCWG